ncbi:uncharacterized protein LOC133740904 [Rosa rugosa]|uniref:uncharacterized protein LOC133740904 n=1 Tax=Rosa rugosa TaxID=74645 RepID=UPI002B412C50|nr:uncharacterized protein LOC133740904 [Rosa rugosa]
MFALTSMKGIGRRLANIVCKKADVDMNRRLLKVVLRSNTLLELHSPLEQCSPQEQQQIDSGLFSSDYDGSFLDGFSDLDSSDDEVTIDPTSEAETKLMSLVKMG